MKTKRLLFVVTAFLISIIYSCKKEDSSYTQYYYGQPTILGNGTAWSWIEINNQNNVKTLGITFEKSAFNNLPTTGDETEYILLLPQQKTVTPFQNVVLNWNPHGHPPAHIYDLPHFDMHFYMIAETDRLKIPEYEADSTGFLKYPATDYLPANYFPIPGGEAKMGTHWVDVTSPELSPSNPQPFTQTFVYGSYSNNVTFYEPMATLAYLTTVTVYTRDIPQPAKFAVSGYYPTKLSFTDKGATLEVTLHDFVYHIKS